MNRSILIVICDFIITSMIYLNGGFSGVDSRVGNGGNSPADRSTVNMIISDLETQRAALEAARNTLLQTAPDVGSEETWRQELQRISSDLAETRTKLEFMRRTSALTAENAGALSDVQVQQELAEEIRQKNLAQAQYELLQAQLNAAQADLAQRNADLAQRNADLAQRDADLQTLQQRNSQLQRERDSVQQQLAVSGAELEAARGEVSRLNEQVADRENELKNQSQQLGAVQSELASTRQELSEANTGAAQVRRKLGDVESELAFQRGRSDALEKQLAAARDQLSNSERRADTNGQELAAARTRLENMQQALRNAISERSRVLQEQQEMRNTLSANDRQREELQTELTRLQGEYNALEIKYLNAESRLQSDVLTRYTNAALRMRIQLREKRLISDRVESNELFLPVVSINNRNYVISTLRALTGSNRNSSAWSDVTELNYIVSAPSVERSPAVRVSGPILVDSVDCRVALLEAPALTGVELHPLKVLTLEELKERGIQDLYLFKINSFGKDSTILDTRCSMSFGKDDNYLYIRNGAKVTSELKAEVGDLVLTKQGELVAVVVALEDYEFGRQQEARCFVFGALPDTGKLPQIALTKPAGQQFFLDFCSKLNYWLEKAQVLDNMRFRR